ncbi:hypothetical protein [Pseudomonas sp. G5(2012)]|uniref:hypothetical protein n=1 Tax=Pseudomonas sp. G5(2012) TaxID=1268068 RepID=UPI0012DC01A8|nr:hypothetical protein [Pseudomonas sp. G5(2012)]
MTEKPKNTIGRDFFPTSTEDFIRFLEAKTKSTCPACEHANWSVLCEPGDDQTYRYGFQVRNVDRRPHISVFNAFCLNCGFMRSHLSRIVHEWVQKNPEEQIELDLGDNADAEESSDE